MAGREGRRRRAGRAASLIGVALAGALAVGCGGSEKRLVTLKSDPMATYALPNAIDTRTNEVVGGTSGVSSPSIVRISFTVPAGGAADAIAEIASAATEAGWALREREPNGFSGDKTIDGISAQILIAGIDQDDTVWIELSSRDG